MHPVLKLTPEIDSQGALKLKVELDIRRNTELLGIPAGSQLERCPALFPGLKYCLGAGEDSHSGLTRSQ